MTGRLIIDLFTTLDGVAQAPGRPDEDPSGGFPFGGWQAPIDDDVVGADLLAGIATIDALVLGRRTYDIWAAYWPGFGDDHPIARVFNGGPKYVASRSAPPLEWAGSERIGHDITAEVDRIRARHRNIHVFGSVDLVQTLLAHDLYDELKLWVYPLVLGQGKKVFPDGATPARLRLLEMPVTGDRGTVLVRYAPSGAPTAGTIGA